MSFFGALLERRSVENPLRPLTDASLVEALGESYGNDAGVSVTTKSVLGIPAVWRAVKLRAGTGASLPLHTFRAGTRQRAVSRLLEKPHPDMTEFELREWMWQSLDLWGNVYLFKQRNQAGVITALLPISASAVKPGRVKADRDVPSGKVFEVTGDNGVKIPWTGREVLHIPGFSPDGVAGIAPVSIARQSFGMTIAAERHGARMFGGGALVSGVLTVDAKLDEDSAKRVKQRWRDMVSSGRANEIAVLGAGAKFQPVQMPNSDAQFLESRKFQVSEVARWFGIPPHMLYDVDRSTSWGTGIEQQGIGFVVYSLRPDLVRFEQRLTAEATPPGTYARHVVEGLLRGDSKSRAEFYRVMIGLGVMNRDEVRDLEDKEPLPDGAGEDFVQPLNMGVVGDVAPVSPDSPLSED